MSLREENNSIINYNLQIQNLQRETNENFPFSFSNSKNRNSNLNLEKNSSSKKRGKQSKLNVDRKQGENNERPDIKTPQTQASKVKKGLAGDRFIPVRSTEENTSNVQYMMLANKRIENYKSNGEYLSNTQIMNNNLINNNVNNTNNSSIHGEISQQINTNNNYQTLMLDSLLLRSNSESFSMDRNQIKNLTSNNESNRERVLSFNSGINNSMPVNKNPKTFINQIKNMVEQKSLSDNFHLQNKFASVSNRLREINQTPERILDAPQLIDDYYLNLIDWSTQNILAVSLGSSVYLWNGNTYETLQLMSDNDNICSVNWMNSGSCLAIGLKGGNIELWDTVKLQQIRNMSGHGDRVCSLSWNNYLLSSGSKDTKILNHDVRVRNHVIHKLSGHTQEVCALKWSSDGNLLASGGNDNLLCIWDVNNVGANNTLRNRSASNSNLGSNLSTNLHPTTNNTNNLFYIRNNNLLNHNINGVVTNPTSTYNSTSSIWNIIEESDDTIFNRNNIINNVIPPSNNNFNVPVSNEIFPKFVFTQHEAAVKAIAWCPWQKGLLASGGGAKDKSIKFWNVDNGSLINSIETGSQVCALLWNKHEKEIISSHGYSKHQISIWKYPSMYKLTELNGHMSRVLYLAMSPDGCSIVSGAGDETLRFWKIHDNKKTISNDSLDYKSSSSKIMNSFQLR